MGRIGVMLPVAGVLALLGTLILLVGLLANARQDQLEADGKPATATVIDKERKVTRNRNYSPSDPSKGPRENITFDLTLRFTPEGEDLREVTGAVYEQQFQETEIGDEVGVIYSASDPGVWDWAGVERSRGPANAALYIGGFLIFIALIIVAKAFGLFARRR